MAKLTTYLRHGPVAAVAIVALLIAPPVACGVTVDVVLTLTAPSVGFNTFNVSGDLNTLAPSLGIVSEDGSVELAGEIHATLHLELDEQGGPPVLTAIDLGISNLMQSPLSLQFAMPVGTVAFSTTQLETEISTPTGPITVTNGLFNSNAVTLMQTGGMADVTVPLRDPKLQDLSADMITAMFDVTQHAIRSASIDVSPAGGEEFLALLEIPLDGQTLMFTGVGLPMSIEFTSGVLRATGNFVLPVNPIPEPATGVLAALFAGLALLHWRQWKLG